MSVLSAIMREAAGRAFPAVAIPQGANFAPMRDLSRGDFSSSVALEIARSTKQDASTIATCLIAEISQSIPGDWHAEAGYIVCARLPRDVWLAEVVSDARAAVQGIGESTAIFQTEGTSGCREILCLVPDVTEPLYARIRLIARVVLQSLLAVAIEGRVRLWLYPQDAVELRTLGDALNAFRAAVERALLQENERRVEVPQDLVRPYVGMRHVWTSHHYHNRLSKSAREWLSKARQSETIELRMPNDAWLLSRNRALSTLLERRSLEKIVSRLDNAESWWRFLFHAASTILSGDFDPAVALFDEFASPLYSARVLVERYARLAPLFPFPVAKESIVSMVREIKSERELMLRGLCMPMYSARAIAKGEVSEWCEAFEDLLGRGHRFLNSPQTRLALAQGKDSDEVFQIVASLGFGLSSILPFVTEGA